MAFNNVNEVTNSDAITSTDRTAAGPAPDGNPPSGDVSWGSITGTPTSAAGYGIVNGDELDALAAISGFGLVVRTADNAYATRTLTAGDNVSITNPAGTAGNPTISVPSIPWADITSTPTTLAGYGITDAQPLDGDLTAIAALSSTGYARRTGSNAWTLDAFVPESLGGTGETTYAQGDLLVGNGSSGLTKLTAPVVPGYVLGSGISGAVSWVESATNFVTSITGTANQVIASASVGSVTLSLPQSIATSSTPEFARLGVGVPAYSSNQRLVVSSGAVASPPTWFPADVLMVEAGSGNNNIQIFSDTGTLGALRFSRPGLRNAGGLAYNHSTNLFDFVVNGSGVGSITSTGVNSMAVGTDSPSTGRFTDVTMNVNSGTALASRGRFRSVLNGTDLTTWGFMSASTIASGGGTVSLAAEAGTDVSNTSRLRMTSEPNTGFTSLVSDANGTATALPLRIIAPSASTISAYLGATLVAQFASTGALLGVQSALATTATTGFAYIPTCAGTPTGVPTAVTGLAPLVVNTTNNKLYFYSGGAWRDAGP